MNYVSALNHAAVSNVCAVLNLGNKIRRFQSGRIPTVLTVAPVDQQTISGASPAGQEVQASSLQSRLDRQNQLFKEQAASDAAPSSGEKKSLLGDFSLAASARQVAIDRGFRTRLAAISSDGFPEQDRISHDLMLRELDQRMTDYSLKTYEMPLTQFRGIHSDLADIPRSLPSLGGVVAGKTDGVPMEVHRTKPSPGLTLSVPAQGPQVLHL